MKGQLSKGWEGMTPRGGVGGEGRWEKNESGGGSRSVRG